MTSASDLDLSDLDPAGQEYIRRLLAHAGEARLPELFSNPNPDAAYDLENRHGVGVIALRTADLTKPQLLRIREFRLAQYLSAGLVNPAFVYLKGLRHESPSSVSADDIHIIAAVPTTGELLSYLTVRAPGAPPTAIMKDQFRPLLPVEQAFGRDVYSNLAILPDLPVTRVLELSRFVKNRQFVTPDERIVRAPVEVTVALHHILCKLPDQWVVVGSVEERVAKRNLDFFHIPLAIFPQATPVISDDGFMGWACRFRRFVPFAFLVADLVRQRPRLAAIENALALAGAEGIRALFKLKRDTQVPRSSLEPACRVDVDRLTSFRTVVVERPA